MSEYLDDTVSHTYTNPNFQLRSSKSFLNMIKCQEVTHISKIDEIQELSTVTIVLRSLIRHKTYKTK